jgi:starvation-inducible outer membrane lipoprotein
MMKKTIAFSGLAISALLLTACASNPTALAIQKENNQYEVTGLGKNQLTSKNNAINAANKACGSRSTPIVVDEKTTYNGALKGVVDEQTGQMIQAAATVLGNIAGTNTGLNQNDDYQTVLTFRCQAK